VSPLLSMAKSSVMAPSCEDFGSTLHCAIETSQTNCEFAFYIDINGVRVETRWYSSNSSIKYEFGDDIVHYYKVTFFLREEDGTIHSDSIERKTHWSYCDGILTAVKLLTDKKSTILEFGSGCGSQELSTHCAIYSVEHDEKFVGLFPEVNYIHAPLKPTTVIEEFGEKEWYDADIVAASLPKKIDLIMVDGPPSSVGRSGLLNHLDIFPETAIWLIDDVLRVKDQQLSNYLALNYRLIQYRFWNFSILSSKPIHSEKVRSIQLASEQALNSESKIYLNIYYPSYDG